MRVRVRVGARGGVGAGGVGDEGRGGGFFFEEGAGEAEGGVCGFEDLGRGAAVRGDAGERKGRIEGRIGRGRREREGEEERDARRGSALRRRP